MSLSFKDSLENNKANVEAIADETVSENLEVNDVETPSVMAYSMRSIPVMANALYNAENWQIVPNSNYYKYYNDEYSDSNFSTIDESKNIILDPSQFNITQEKNSQYIPFQIPRFYDGFDLTKTKLGIYYVNKNKDYHTDIPVDVYYNDDYIRFAWLVSEFATQVAGVLQFEIHAVGTNSKGESYTWKSKSIDKLNVLQSLEDVAIGEIGLSEEEIESWYNQIVDAANTATSAASNAQRYANEAAATYRELQNGIADEVQTAIDNTIGDVVDTAINTKLENYYTTVETYNKDEIDDKIAEVKPEGYATEDYVDTEIGKVNDKFGNLVNLGGDVLTVEQFVKQEVEAVDVSDELGDLGTNEDGTTKTVVQYVDEAVAAVDVSEQLKDYAKGDSVYKKSETYSKTEVDEALANISLDGYATETYVDNKVSPLSSSIGTNAENISSLSKTVGDLQSDVNLIDKSPRLTYDVEYNDVENPDVGENVFVFYEIENEGEENEVKEAKKKFTIVGGSGGGASSSLKISYITTSPVVATVNDRVIIKYNFSGTDSSGDIVPEGNYTWKIGNKIIASGIATNGENTFDATDFATTTSQKFVLTITDDGGSLVTKSWTVQQVDVRLESNFSDAYGYNGNVSFNYTPYGAIEKDIHFVLDGKEIDTVATSTSGIPTSYTIPSQTYGSHLLEVYITTTINNTLIESNHLYKDILWIDSTDSIPVIGCSTPTIDVVQYNTVNMKYTVIDPSTETPKVTWYLGDEVVSEETLTEKDEYGYYTYSYKANTAGTFVFTITCGEAKPKVITLNVEELDIDVSPVTAGLEFDFNPVGYSNSSANKLWSYNDVTMTVSDNFDWVNGGYQIDDNGDQYFCVKAGTAATINYNLFADDPKKSGKEFKTIFRTKNIRKRDTSFLTCLDNGIGLDMKVENATIYESGGLLKSDYCEDTIIEYEFNINKDTDMMIVMSYEDGTPSKPYEYKETSSFKQSSPQPITIGSEDCDVHIYRMKAYSISLTDTDIKNNFIADARNADEIIARYTRNQIYNKNGELVSTSANGDFNADALMKAAPDLRYIFIEVPQFTNDKDNKIDGCTVYFRYPNGTRPQDNWDCTGMRHRGQGTSSNLYGYAGRNIDLCMDRDTSLFTYTDEEGNLVESSTITLTDTSVPTDYLNIKVNIASSENANNAQLARRFNEYQPFLRYARKKDGKVKDTMEFYNCVIFIRETSTDLSNTPHREFNDTNWHFYGIGNVGDSKKTDDTRVNNANDPKEHIIEITDADKPLSAFPTGKEANAICPVEEWREGNTAYDILHSIEYVYDEEGAFESFGGTTYEFRYEMEDITEEQREANINAWRDLYKFIVTSTDEEFYANLKNYFVVDSALYYYLFTERYTMVDNRGKNSFWHYGKVYISETEAVELGEIEASYYIIDNEAAAINDGYRYDLTFGYDMDTALGIDNTGDYVFSYGKEDTDYYVDGDPTSDYVFRVANSVFFCRLRDLFPSEMQAMFKDREEKNAWSSTSLVDQWNNSQSQFPEELWRLDYERKYYRTYLGLSIDNSISKGIDKTFLIGKFFGRKKYARQAFEPNQEIYFATKYFGNKALEDVFWIRGNVPIGSGIAPNYSLTLVPYSDMYVCVKYSSTGTPINQKVKAGQTCYFESDAERMDFIYVYAASFIQEVGDLSRCYVGDNNFSSATRLQKLVIGSTDEGYENTFMKEVLVANNPLLEHLDLRNISGINTVIDVSGCSNLKELYAEGTNATGVIFANGGLLQTAHLPNTIKSLSMKNLNYITDDGFIVSDGFGNLETLIVENTPNINTYNIVTNAPKLNTLRLINLNWDETYHIEDGAVFDRLLTIGGRDSSGYETDVSVLSGDAHVIILKEQQSHNYKESWSDLEITYNTMIMQHPVTFVNEDGTVLEVQYVNEGECAIDPVTRVDNPLSIPTKESTVSTDYTFAGWDRNDLDTYQIFTALTVTATYSESTREYTIRYVSKSASGTVVKQESVGKYGENIPYDFEANGIPTYTYEENAYNYYLFNRWDKSGFIDGDKTVTAIFDSFKYTGTNSFAGKDIGNLKPVELYALTKLTESGKAPSDFGMSIEVADPFSFTMGYDVDFDDIESNVVISEKTSFSGTNYFDTGVKLFDEDRDFVLALDYTISSDNTEVGTFMQCFQTSGSNGFKLGYSGSAPEFVWGSATPIKPSSVDNREMLVIRHKKGDNNLYVYVSNLDGTEPASYTIERNAITQSDNATLIFGAAKMDSGRITSYCMGDVHWCKIWYQDLGEKACEQLVGWTHEEITLGVSGFYRYPLYDDRSKETMVSLIASHLLDRKMKYNTGNTNAGGWAESNLNKVLNSRFYNAVPVQIRLMLKKMCVLSTIGQMSTEVSESGCYVNIPSVYDVDSNETTYKNELYSGASTITTMATNKQRIREYRHGYNNDNVEAYDSYWLRSPNIAYTNYVWSVNENYANHNSDSMGSTSGFNTANTNHGVVIEVSF